MRCFCEGKMYDIQSVTFDVIGQTYTIYCKQYRVLDNWRRESCNFSINVMDAWLQISPTTPHITKLSNDELDEKEICEVISNNVISYIEYAGAKRNTTWVSYVTTNEVVYRERVDLVGVESALGITTEEMRNIVITKAY